MQKIKTICNLLLVVVFISPLLGIIISIIAQSSESDQYTDLQLGLMIVYNLPFFVASLVTFLLGNSVLSKKNNRISFLLYFTSIMSSIIGTLIMLAWGLGKL